MARRYITTAIPYVNSKPHLGFAMELVETDVMARHWRHRGHEVRFLTGTDDNSLKNAIAAEAEGIPTAELVDRNAGAFRDLRGPLEIGFDDFIRTSGDPRHKVGVERLWRATRESGDLYRKHYEGLYCVGCEQFYAESELVDGLCPEHLTKPQLVSEENWFFKLSRYQDRLRDLIEKGELRIEPPSRRNEVLGFINSGLQDFSISRSIERARGWGIAVPDDPDQVIYVWWDALGNYITALDYGTDGDDYRRWWRESDDRTHVIGKGIVRFHAVYWPAMLMSAGQPLPTSIFVHDYLTVDGRKLGKSLGNAIDPVAIVDQYGVDALRWWLVREVPRVGDADFTADRLVSRYHEDLANGLGNLVNRTVSMVHKYRDGVVPPLPAEPATGALAEAIASAPGAVDAALAEFDFRRATAALWKVVDEANRYVVEVAPWTLAKAEKTGDSAAGGKLSDALAMLVHAIRTTADELTPFLPGAAGRVQVQVREHEGKLPQPRPLFPRIEDSTATSHARP
ncbi:methionine--tRNA ligase [Actinokineospora iranica]|uniref:methionine--tRNA ligase n=1 Tax=Actinokineospora iranica TaxID=1271860 RepID=A0A1G6MUK6_9PSEU|nr:class I tRNA ligase family protein [Actinokineospora iranica]SDC59121.1 methionyl-tRNA synthetase [Actinokineospora iranica]